MQHQLNLTFRLAEATRVLRHHLEKSPSRRTPDPNALARVRRNLFGVDRVTTQRFLDRELSCITNLQSSRWNFDFNKGKPTEESNGRYRWEKVGPTNKILQPLSKKIGQHQKKITDYLGKRKFTSGKVVKKVSKTAPAGLNVSQPPHLPHQHAHHQSSQTTSPTPTK